MQKQPQVARNTLSAQVSNAKSVMVERGYAKKTIDTYTYVWHQLIVYAQTERIITCTDDLLIRFARNRYGIENIFQPATDKEKYYARILLCLNDVAIDGSWITRRDYGLPKHFQSSSFEEAFLFYTNRLVDKGLKRGSILLKQQILRDFLSFAEIENIHNICEFSVTTISDYLKTKERYSTPTKSNIIITLRDFLKTPLIATKLSVDLSVNLKVSNNGRYEKLPSVYSKDEIRSILSCVDRKTQEGKKDYAVILLAVDTGIRFSDIVNLKITDIKWDSDSIEIIQLKTGEFVTLTISDALKFALLDYLMYARPKNTKYDNLFLRSMAPFAPYVSAGHYYKRLNKYIKEANININGRHHGIHTMRHSLATRLMNDNVSITAISGWVINTLM